MLVLQHVFYVIPIRFLFKVLYIRNGTHGNFKIKLFTTIVQNNFFIVAYDWF